MESITELDGQIQALVAERNALDLTVDRQFSITEARDKLRRHYDKVQAKE